MTNKFLLAHVSDLHMTKVEDIALGDLNVKRGLGLLNWARSRNHIHSRAVADLVAADIVRQKPDHVAVTGDLANLGLPFEYHDARTWLESLGSPDRVSVVPGNHDIYTGEGSEAALIEAWSPFLTGDIDATDHAFPFVRRRGPVVLIGLNSAVPTRPFIAAGRLGARQIERLDRCLSVLSEPGLIRVVLIHHPPLPGLAPRRRALADADALTEGLARHRVDLVLHGHNHTEMVTWLDGVDGPVPIIGVPSGSARTTHGREPRARYYLFAITRIGAHVELTKIVRGLGSTSTEIVELARTKLVPH
ncbi:MAG: metallophosphoesterase [Hyphomicrobium sp.]|nr:metallophosphoesterase [Hyphomicrobium sp.]